MSAGRYFGGLLVLAVFLLPLCAGGLRLRRWLAPELTSVTGLCAQVIVVVALIVLILEGLGLLSLLQAVPVAATGAAVGGGLWVGLRDRQPPAAGPVPAPPELTPFNRVAICIALAAVGAPWLGWTAYAYRHGMETPDTLWYHLPQAARFVQNGNIRELQYFDGGPVTAFYPANAELLHALGMLALKSDLLSPLINLFWGGFAMFSAWAVGRPFGRGAHTLLAMALLLGTPAFVDTQPGGAYNDIVGVALLAAAVAVLVHGGVSRGPLVIAAMAAGLCLGTKFTMIVAAVALGVGLVAVPAAMPHRHRAAIWLAGLVGLGGFWYARNAAATGTPAPTLPFHLDALIPTPSVSPTVTVWHNLFVGHVWRAYYLPGLRSAFGPGWWGILALAAGGVVAAVAARRRPVLPVLGWVAVVAAVGYLITPQFLGSPLAPIYFVYNLRYAAPALVLGLLLAPFTIPAAPGWLRNAALAGGLALLAVTELDSAIWPTDVGHTPFAPPLRGASAVLGGSLSIALTVIAVAATAPRVRRHARPALTYAVVAAVLVGGGWLVSRSYEKRRYTSTGPLPHIFAWARSVHRARIALIGSVAQYPLLGTDDSNFVQFLGHRAPHGGYDTSLNAAQWQSALRSGHYGWVVVAPAGFPFSTQAAPQLAWTRSIPGAREVISERPPGAPSHDRAVLFELTTTSR